MIHTAMFRHPHAQLSVAIPPWMRRVKKQISLKEQSWAASVFFKVPFQLCVFLASLTATIAVTLLGREYAEHGLRGWFMSSLREYDHDNIAIVTLFPREGWSPLCCHPACFLCTTQGHSG